MTLFGEDRESLRATWRDAWRRHQAGLPLEPLQAQLAELVAMHPEYHAALEGADPAQEPPAELSGTPPFLHLALHAAVRDGIATNRPAGLRAAFQSIATRCRDAHQAEHVLLECLGETLWEAQRNGTPPDEATWLERVRHQAGG